MIYNGNPIMLWPSIFVTLALNNFVFRTGLRTVSGNRYKNGAGLWKNVCK